MRISDWSSDVCLPILHATVLDENGKACVMYMGCYGIGVSRIVAACIEQNADAAGICWPAPMAPWQVAVCIINPKSNPDVVAAANAMYDELLALGIDVVLDDRGLRPGPMLSDIELIGIPHRIVVSERGMAAGTFEYRARSSDSSESLNKAALLMRIDRTSVVEGKSVSVRVDLVGRRIFKKK